MHKHEAKFKGSIIVKVVHIVRYSDEIGMSFDKVISILIVVL